MGKIVDNKNKKKKKGRPSLLDLQKRTLKQQQQPPQKPQFPNRNPPFSNNLNSAALRRSRRRNPDIDSQQDEDDEEEEEEEDEGDEAAQLNGKRREKKLKLVLKLPSNLKLDPDSANGSESNGHEGYSSVSGHRKRKIDAISDGSGKREKSVSNPTDNAQDWESSTPLPDKKLLLFILDRLQKKDTHGVFSEPVDPDELPDYHEVIAHPMDFATVRKKLSSGAYATLEQFEKDVYLISSNAMQYNAPDTVYFRQARSIHELAKKSFDNLRQDSDDNEPGPKPKSKPEPVLELEPEPEPEPKVARRGRPPTKHLKRPVGRPPLTQAHSDFSFNSNLMTGGESTPWSNNDTRRGPITSDRSSFGKPHGTRIDSHWSTEKNSEATGSIFKGSPFKYGKKQSVVDENRRNTYDPFSSSGREPSVLATFDAERKQLVAVGLLSEHGYARSLARFAANIGPVAWKIASTRIERSLPPGLNYGPGWVGENDIPPERPVFLSSSPPALSLPENSCNAATSSKENPSKPPENNSKENNGISNKPEPPLETEGSHCNSNKFMPRPPVQTGMNGFHMPGQMGKPVEPGGSTGFNFQSSNSLTRNNTSLTHCSQNPNPTENSMDSVPPDLNVMFQSPGSPSSNSNRLESGQPDLVLQL